MTIYDNTYSSVDTSCSVVLLPSHTSLYLAISESIWTRTRHVVGVRLSFGDGHAVCNAWGADGAERDSCRAMDVEAVDGGAARPSMLS